MKEFLSNHRIDYLEIDLTKHPEKEADLKSITGSRIVPGILIKTTGLLRLFNKEKHFIGFEQNLAEIKKLIKS